MIPDRYDILRYAEKRNRDMPEPLLEWLLLHFSDEMWPGQYDETLLESLVDLYCDAYAKNPGYYKLPSPAAFYKQRYQDAKDMILDLLLTIEDQEKEIDAYREQLEEHGLL